QAQRVFERLHLGVVREAFLAHDRLHAPDRRVVVAGRREQGTELASVLLLQQLAPAEVAGPTGRRRCARHGPPAKVVTTRREQQWLARVRAEVLDPLGYQLGVDDLLRAGARSNGDDVRVVGVAG